MNTGKVTYGTMKNFLRDLEVVLDATVTPPYKNPVNQIVDCNSTVYKLVSALHLADPLPCL